MHKSGGTYMRAEPFLAKELIWAGFDIVSTANNHTGDYGTEGMRLTLRISWRLLRTFMIIRLCLEKFLRMKLIAW